MLHSPWQIALGTRRASDRRDCSQDNPTCCTSLRYGISSQVDGSLISDSTEVAGITPTASRSSVGVRPSRCTRYSSSAVAGDSDAYTQAAPAGVQRALASLGANGSEASLDSMTRYMRRSPCSFGSMNGDDGVAADGDVCDGGSLAGKVSASALSSARMDSARSV